MTLKLNFFLQSYVVWNFIVKNSLIRNFFIAHIYLHVPLFYISYLHPSVFYQINCLILIFNTFDIESWKKNCQVEIEIKTPLFIYFDFNYYKCRHKKLQLLVLNIFQFIYWFPIKNYLQFKQNFNAHVFNKKNYRNLQFLHRLHQNETKIQLIFSCLLTLKNISPILTLHEQELLK